MEEQSKEIVIIGAGFAGLNVAKQLGNTKHKVTLIDRTNHHLFQPLLYQVAVAALSPADIAVPIRAILKKKKNIKVLMAEVKDIDLKKSVITLEDKKKIRFDDLIIATGARHSYFKKPQWEKFAPGLKTLNDALGIREKILISFEKAELSQDLEKRKNLLTFIVVGGGPTGVEMAGAIAEISKKTLKENFHSINPNDARVILIEAGPRILASYHATLSEKARKSLQNLGVEVYLNLPVTSISSLGLITKEKNFKTSNLIWAAGNKASPLISKLNVDMDKSGRAMVKKDCSIDGYANVFVIGDAANMPDEQGNPLPGIAPVALQQGKYIGKLLKKDIGPNNRKAFNYINKGTMATIGRARAIAEIKSLRLSGFIAWLMWGVIHIMYLIGFRNRSVVMFEWFWHFVSYQRAARLITRI